MQGLHHVLHLHEARALDQHRRGRPAPRPARPAARRRRRSGARRAVGRGRMRRTARRRSRACSMPRCARVGADLGVERRALVADLAHVAQHQPARAGQRGQHVDGGAHRVGVGVVAVVDQRDARGRRAAAPCSLRAALSPARRPPGPAPPRASGAPAASAQAVAASALFTLCRPARRSARARCAGRRVQRQRPAVAPATRAWRCTSAGAVEREGQHARARRPARATAACSASSAGNTAMPSARQRLDDARRSRAPPPRRWP